MSEKNGSTLSISFRIDEGVVEHNNREFIAQIADKNEVNTEVDIANPEKRLKLLPNYISSIKDETSEDQLKLKRASDLITAYEKIVEGNYIDNLIRAQREQKVIKL